MKTDHSHPGRPPAHPVFRATPPPADSWPQLTAAVELAIRRKFGSLRKRQPRLLQQALNEAAALAWWTGLPHLTFPTLALEKIAAVEQWDTRQRAILRATNNDDIGVAA
jgi:hypothetical protein